MKWSSEHTRHAKTFARHLKKSGFDFFTGVPCSLLGALLEELDDRYVPAVREDAAIGMASGAFLAGRRPVVLMQNSGLGYSINALTSLNLIYKIPVLCLVTHRGHGPDAPEHLVMGRSCEALLREIGVRTAVLEAGDLDGPLDRASETIRRTGEPFAILVRKGVFGA